jgi:hypothetical protein
MSERCACGGVPYVSEKLDEMRAANAKWFASRGLTEPKRVPRCADCIWKNIQKALDPAQDINAPGGAA